MPQKYLRALCKGSLLFVVYFSCFLTSPVYAVDETTTEEIITNEYVGGGTAQNWNGDDANWNYTLPFTFNFYGVDYTDIKIGSNGYICLDNTKGCTDYSPNINDSDKGPVIFPLGIDLRTDVNPTNDVYITENADNVIFRWNAVEFGRSNDINFEVVLYSNGNIKFNYGDQDSPPLSSGAVVGITKGDGATYTESTYHNTTTFHQVGTSVWGSFGPAITSTTPVDDSSAIATSQSLSVTFDRNVFEGTGNITIKKKSDNSTIETIAADSAQVTGWGTNTITINPVNHLPAGSFVYINIDQGVVKDVDDNLFGGIVDTTSWNFSTDLEIVKEIPVGECYEVGSAEAVQPAGTTLAYSDDGKSSWSYTPSDQGNGGDCAVTHVRLTIAGDSASVGEDLESEFVGTVSHAEVVNNSGGEVILGLNTPSLGGTYTFGGTSSDYALDVTTDSNGNFLTIGSLKSSSADFDATAGSDIRSLVGVRDVFIVKYNTNGSYAWTRTIGGAGAVTETSNSSVATNASGDVFVTGSFSDTVDFDGTSGTDEHTAADSYGSGGISSVFLTKYNASGSYGWTRTFGQGASHDAGNAVAVNSSGDIFVVGQFENTVNFDATGGTDEHTSAGGLDFFLTKYNADGSYAWTRTIGGTGTDMPRAIATDSNGDVFVTGYFYEVVDFDATGGEDLQGIAGSGSTFFITKYNSDGSYGWTRTPDDPSGSSGLGIATNTSGDVFAVGYFGGASAVDFDGTTGVDDHTNTPGGSYDSFVTKYNASGSYGWTRTFGTGTGTYKYELASGVDTDSNGNIFIAGRFEDTVDFDGTGGVDEHTSNGNYDAYITRYNADGSYGWTRTFGGAAYEGGSGLTVSGSSIFVADQFQNIVDFDGTAGVDNHASTSGSNSDAFIVKYGTDGSYGTMQSSGYAASGTYQTTINLTDAIATDQIQLNTTIPASTSMQYTVLDGSCNATLMGPTSNTTIDISSLNTTSLCLQVSLATTNDSITPTFNSWSASYTPESSVTSLSFTTVSEGPGSAPSVTTASTTDISDRTATANGNITDTGGEAPTRTLEWGTISGTYTDSCTAGTGSTGLYECQMTNLFPNTTYYVRAVATNSLGTSYGNEVSFVTSPLQDIIIPNPTPVQMNSRVGEGYMSISEGSMTIASSTITNVNVTYRTTHVDAVFPTGTVTTEASSGNYNFENFTIQNITNNVKNEQPSSRVAFRLGVPSTSLNFSQNVNITAFVGEAYNNQEMDILYQNEGETTWNTQGTCTVTSGNCTFTTDHATIYTINGNLQATGSAPVEINTEVVDTLTLDCYDTTQGTGNYDVTLGTTSNPGFVTAGTPAVGTSTCDATTNDDQGYYLSVVDDNAATNTVLTHNDPNTATIYEIQDLTPWNETTKTTENWTAPTTKGLGFSIISFPDTDTSNNTFDGVWTETGSCPEGNSPDSNDYAGIPDTPEAIAAVPEYSANLTTTNICYKVDVPASQPSGTYTGSVTYTATSDASSYLN